MKLFSALIGFAAVAAVTPVLMAQTSQRTTSTSYSIHTPARKYSFALVNGQGSISCWGNWDSGTFRELNARTKVETLYVKKGDEMYAITDRGILGATRKVIEPMERLGKQQGELGRRQGELGKQQGELGRRQGELGRQMGEAVRGRDSTERIQELSKEQAALGKQQAALGERQSELGGQQAELGKRQAELAKEADEKITKLIDDAFARGLAVRVS